MKSQVISLEARGESTNDLLVNVFKGYQMAHDEDFAQFIKRKKDAYNEGADITVASLMDAAENKYKTWLLTGEWSASTQEQEQILALTAQVDKLRILLLLRRTSRKMGSPTHLILRKKLVKTKT